ncbi:MAG: SAM-dependent chlorinase/fluorinase [Anaerolineaceae bacterium]|nr:SAM-dependent chlorinase/fluorinase [Anaerolineaceae bacterium]
MKYIALLTDFGLKDAYVGVMKGVILGIAPDVQIADISHSISPQNVLEGALALGRSAPYFSEGTVHMSVVDPGVGTRRRPIAAWLGSRYFVGPDNGLCTVLLERTEKNHQEVHFVQIDQPRYWLPEISNVFHGRDIFSPVAAHLANGVPLEQVGTPIYDPVRLTLPGVSQLPNGWQGKVIMIDHFGNLATNILRSHLEGMEKLRVRIAGAEVQGLVRTFGDRQPGELIALFGTQNDLIVSVVNGNAAQRLNVGVGEQVEILAG